MSEVDWTSPYAIIAPDVHECIHDYGGTGPAVLSCFIREKAKPFLKGCGVDLGCGLEKVIPEAIGVDNDVMHQWSAANIKTDIWEFEARDLDYVYSSHFLEHFPDWDRLLAKMCGMLRKGGTLFLYLPNPEANTGWSFRHSNAARSGHRVDLSPELVVDKLKELGMKVVEYEPRYDWYASFHVVATK